MKNLGEAITARENRLVEERQIIIRIIANVVSEKLADKVEALADPTATVEWKNQGYTEDSLTSILPTLLKGIDQDRAKSIVRDLEKEKFESVLELLNRDDPGFWWSYYNANIWHYSKGRAAKELQRRKDSALKEAFIREKNAWIKIFQAKNPLLKLWYYLRHPNWDEDDWFYYFQKKA